MGDIEELCDFLQNGTKGCIIPDANSFITTCFLVVNFWPIYFGMVLLGVSLFRCNYICILITITIYVDNLINYSLRDIVGASNNFQPDACPLPSNQMPALASQKLVVLYTVVWFLLIYAYPTQPSKSTVLLANLLTITVLFSRLYLMLSTPVQIIAGAGAGLLEGIVLCFIFYYMKIHKIDAGVVRLTKRYYELFNETPLECETQIECPSTL